MITRKIKRTAVVAFVLSVALGLGLATAAWLARSPISGSVKGSDAMPTWQSFPAPAAQGSGAPVCSAQLSDTTLSVQADLYAAGTCKVTASLLTANGTPEMRLTKVTLSGLPTGYVATLNTPCGTALTAGNVTSASFTITRAADAPASASKSITSASSGIESVLATEYSSALCS
jgi:hypothetical protein